MNRLSHRNSRQSRERSSGDAQMLRIASSGKGEAEARGTKGQNFGCQFNLPPVPS